MSRPQRVLVGVCGGIAAYKSAFLVRRLRERGHEVRCAMTEHARSFLSPLTLEALSGHQVYGESYLETGDGEELHVSLAEWADVMVVAPATANTIARLALGLADDFLTTTALVHDGPLVICPAMHPEMWGKVVDRGHRAVLERTGAILVGPAVGPLASGETGVGRMVEPEQVVEAMERVIADGPLTGYRVLVTAGPTHEAVDPVRYLTNRSSGRMGFALAAEAARQGGEVVLVAGPVDLPTPWGVERVDVTTAVEMETATLEHAVDSDLIIMTAAVSDFRPQSAAGSKIKKRDLADGMTLELERNPDILAMLSGVAKGALRVGFAAETEAVEEGALGKLQSKNADFLVANDVSRGDIGFDSDHNEVTVYARDRDPQFFSRREKSKLARDLITLFAAELEAREARPSASA